MNQKESLSQRIAFHKQEIINAQNTEIQTREAQRLALEERRRLDEIDKQKKEVEIIAATRKNFKGSEIIETLEEIRDKQLLIFRSISRFRFEKKFLGEKRIDYDEITPAKIYLETNTVRMEYDYWSRSGGEYGDDESGCSMISIKKIDQNTFEINNIKGNPQKVIDKIALIVAEHQIEKQSRKLR